MTLLRLPLLCASAVFLAACAGAPVPDWQMNAHDSAERASAAYLRGDTRMAEQEWTRARSELARTGSATLLARLELLRCAAQTASVAGDGCPAFAALRTDAPATEQAYADYLQGRAVDTALLPSEQRAAVASVAVIASIKDPLSRLVAAGAAFQAGRATPELLVLASDTAAAQGWSRPLLAWLRLRQERAQAVGNVELAAQLGRRMALVQGQGRPAQPAKN